MTYTATKAVFEQLFNNEMEKTTARNFLVAMYDRGETVEEITAAAEVMRAHSVKLDIKEELQDKLLDIVGTGGDKSGSFNISSTCSLILASADAYVAKHGNRSITSNSGSADMLEAIGIRLDLDVNQQTTLLEETGFTFLFAGNHHPAMKHIIPIRKSIPHRTIFNILGPLTNPAGVKKQFVGSYDKEFVSPMAQVLAKTGSTHCLVASSYDGLDELSLSAPSFITQIHDGLKKEYELDPQSLGFEHSTLEDIKGGDAKENAAITLSLLKGEEQGPKRDIILLNCAAALIVNGNVNDFQSGIAYAKELIDSKKAYNKLQNIIKVSGAL
jgi:anthranilate phosphoribosyltransferase